MSLTRLWSNYIEIQTALAIANIIMDLIKDTLPELSKRQSSTDVKK